MIYTEEITKTKPYPSWAKTEDAEEYKAMIDFYNSKIEYFYSFRE